MLDNPLSKGTAQDSLVTDSTIATKVNLLLCGERSAQASYFLLGQPDLEYATPTTPLRDPLGTVAQVA